MRLVVLNPVELSPDFLPLETYRLGKLFLKA